MSKDNSADKIEEFWYTWFTSGPPESKIRQQRLFRLLPARKRCKFCFAPFTGFAGSATRRLLNIYPSRFNPHYCNICDDFANTYQGAAVVPITILFADIRGSTPLAEQLDPKAYGELVNHFFIRSTEILSGAGAMIEKIAGDEVTAVFSAGISGTNYAHQAIRSAVELMHAFGPEAESGNDFSIGIGIHSGEARVGAVGTSQGNVEVAALGDVPNTGARLTSAAEPGEILVSEETLVIAGVDFEKGSLRSYTLKGRSTPLNALVFPHEGPMP